MQIYLLKDLKGKGKAGEIISVNDGFGRNYIIKNGIGKAVDNSVRTQVQAKADSDAFHKKTEIEAIKGIIQRLGSADVEISVKIGANGKLFGSVTSLEISVQLKSLGFDVDKKSIVLIEPIRAVGTYKIKVKFNHGLEGYFNLTVKGN